jgi:hypothetical protein
MFRLQFLIRRVQDVRPVRVVVRLRYVLTLARASPFIMVSIQYAFEDFAIRQVAQVLGKSDDVEKYTNRSYVRSIVSLP